ncbi:hypothetical protein BOX15_Mlig034610g1, partial [Macrostomum lignano]
RLTQFLLSGAASGGSSLARLRNFGIVAHIDAGKTTTTERILNAAGAIQAVGSVDRGDTVTDYLTQERQRGITIVSAAVAFKWKGHQLTLIDTPGHVDFAFEVERALCALDGVAVVLDATRGVQAQTVSVVRRARRLGLPALVFLNKLDLLPPARQLPAVRACLRAVSTQLGLAPALINRPPASGGLDRLLPLLMDSQDAATADSELADDRRRLLEAVVESDDDLADKFLSDSLGCSISMATDVLPALARATRRLSLTPTLCGSAKLGAGIPELLDAVLQFLPPPEAPAEAHQKQRLEALAFKTIKDPGRGPLTFFRIFSGRLQPKSSLFVRSGSGVQAAANSPHRCARVYRPFADEFTELPDGAGPGQIAAVSFGQLAGSAAGAVVTGDVVSDRPAGLVDDPGTDADVAADAAGRRRRLPLLRPPDPVVFASVEAESPAWAKPLDEALTGLALEDPGLRLRTDEETGQTVLCGLGELHLQVAGQRLREQLGPNAFRLGPVTVSYRERLVAMATIDSYTLRTESYGAPVEVTVSLELLPRLPADEADSAAEANSETEVVFVNSEAQNWGQLPPQALRAVREGLAKGLRAGPLVRGQVTNCSVRLLRLAVVRAGQEGAPPAKFLQQVTSAIYSAVRHRLSADCVQLTEPLMRLRVDLAETSAPPAAFDALLTELSRRHCSVERVDRGFDDITVVEACGSVAQLAGLPSAVRSATSGHADLHLQLHGYRAVSDQQQAVRRIRFGA